MSHDTQAMKTSPLPMIAACLGLLAPLLTSSCGAPNPDLQQQMDRDILTAAENKAAGSTAAPQQGQGSKNYGHGGF